MPEEKSNKIVTREFLSERDNRIFKMRQAGTSINEIARRFNISTSVVSKAIQRQLEKLNREAMLAYPEVLRMELERLDNLQQAIWPLTQHRKVKMDDGSEATVEPDLKAIQQVLSIMDRRTKLLGMDQTNINVQMDIASQNNDAIKVTLAGQAGVEEKEKFDPESEAKKLLEIMGASGVLPASTVQSLLGFNNEIIEGEIVEEEVAALENSETDYDSDHE
jgi:predicted DNA binding protein